MPIVSHKQFKVKKKVVEITVGTYHIELSHGCLLNYDMKSSKFAAN